MTAIRTWTLFFQFVLNMGYACAMIVHTRADQLLPQLLMETFCIWLELFSLSDFLHFEMSLLLLTVTLQGVSNKHCLLSLFSSPEQRIIGELIVYPWSGIVRCRRPQCSYIFFSETAGPIKAKFYVEPPWVGGTKFCSRHLGHMTKMASMPIYGKNLSKIFFSGTSWPISMKLGVKYRALLLIIVCSIDDPGMTLTYLTARSNFVT